MIAEEVAAEVAAVEGEVRRREAEEIRRVEAAEVLVEMVRRVVVEAAVPGEEALELCPGRK